MVINGNNNEMRNLQTTSNTRGIFISGDSNQLRGIDISSNTEYGVYLTSGSTSNYLTSNTICNNAVDISNSGDSSNTGQNNKCDKTSGWNDQGTTGCTNKCT